MIIKVSQNQSYCLIEILGDNGEPASPQNPIQASEYANVEFPEAMGKLAVISGMPTSAVGMVLQHYKNLFQATAVANPKLGVAEVTHSTTPNHPRGSSIPLA